MKTVTEPLHLRGNAWERGLQQARQCGDMAAQVRAAIALRLGGIDPWLQRPWAVEFMRKQTEFLRSRDEAGFDESRGLAEGWGITHGELLAFLHANVLSDLASARTTEADGCTAWAAMRAGDGALVVKNRDYRGEHGALQRVFLHEDPTAACPRILCVGSLGSPGAFSSGLNAHGLAVVDTQVGTRDHGVGWLRYFLMTALLWRCRGVVDAIDFVRTVPHAGGGTLVLGDAGGHVAAVELSHRGGAVVETAGHWVARTNHFLDNALAGDVLMPSDDPADSTAGRLKVVRAALSEWGPRADAQRARALMSGHEAEGSLCRHPVDGRSRTLSCAIYDTTTRELRLSHGQPCQADWVSYSMGVGLAGPASAHH